MPEQRRPSRGGEAGARGARKASAGRGQPRSSRAGFGRDQDRRRGGEPRARAARSESQRRYDGPPISEDITGRELDRAVAQQLRGLPERLATRVARHLVAAGRLMDSDPQTAYQHTLAARARAARIAVVREACGEAAYAAGEYAEALSELRAARRMTGVDDYLPVMADCERALGRPDKALDLARSPAVSGLSPQMRVEMTIVEAGARRDLGELDAAVRTLENAPLRSRSTEPWLVRLRYAYADTLHATGRLGEALEWFHRTAAIDRDGITDAAERLVELEGVTLTDTVEADTVEGGTVEADTVETDPDDDKR